MTEECPIVWAGKDGQYPCAFYQKYNHGCNKKRDGPWDPPCIPKYKERFYYSLGEVTVLCPRCQDEVKTTRSKAGRGLYPLCPRCAKQRLEGIALLEHAAGRL